MPYLNDARIVNRTLRMVAVILAAVALIATVWGTRAQILWLERAVILLILCCIVGSTLILFRRMQVDLGWGIKPTLIAPRRPNSILPLTGITIALLILLLPVGSTLLRQANILPNGLERIDIFVMTVTLFMAVFAMINHAPEATTVLVKLIGVGLFVVTIVLNSLVLFLTWVCQMMPPITLSM